MKIYKTQRQVEKDIKNGVLAIEGDVKFKCSISINASIVVTAGNIDALNITAGNITAGNITARDINADDILYHAVCFAYKNITCKSIKGTRENAKHFCLDGEITFKEEKQTNPKEIVIDGATYILKQ